MNTKSEWKVSGPESYMYSDWYTIEEWQDGYYQNTTVKIECRNPSSWDEQTEEPVWEKERDLAHFIAQALNNRGR